MTGKLLNVFHDFASSNYTFDEDYVTNKDRKYNENYHNGENNIQAKINKFKENDGAWKEMDTDQIYKLCTNTVVNSSIAISCGPYYDQDIMNAIDICFNGKN